MFQNIQSRSLGKSVTGDLVYMMYIIPQDLVYTVMSNSGFEVLFPLV